MLVVDYVKFNSASKLISRRNLSIKLEYFHCKSKMSIIPFQLSVILAMLSLTLTQLCNTDILVNTRVGLTGNPNPNFTGHHTEAGLTRECIEANIPVKKK